mmetsp:Transcript_20639/g.62166  ORF Transcript_20639/g.62166 Transcript_20639/m.62166 type:complete len:223 (-) Transcript_20639:2042-2710(-)
MLEPPWSTSSRASTPPSLDRRLHSFRSCLVPSVSALDVPKPAKWLALKARAAAAALHRSTSSCGFLRAAMAASAAFRASIAAPASLAASLDSSCAFAAAAASLAVASSLSCCCCSTCSSSSARDFRLREREDFRFFLSSLRPLLLPPALDGSVDALDASCASRAAATAAAAAVRLVRAAADASTALCCRALWSGSGVSGSGSSSGADAATVSMACSTPSLRK